MAKRGNWGERTKSKRTKEGEKERDRGEQGK